MTKQEIFDKVASHLLNQNETSISRATGRCAYRGDDGLSCAIGCLISDEDYRPGMEHRGVAEMLELYRLDILPSDTEDPILFLEKLQAIHDQYGTCEWKNSLTVFAKKENLKVNFA